MSHHEHDLVTARLVLEPLLAAHARKLYAQLRDERLYRFHAGRPKSLAELERRFRKWEMRRSPDGREMWLNYAVRHREGYYVGWVQATITGNRATVGYDIFAGFWRQGFAIEACSEFIRFLASEHGVTTFTAVVDAENVASIALLERLGFIRVWTGPSEDMPGRSDYRYERRNQAPPDVPSAL